MSAVRSLNVGYPELTPEQLTAIQKYAIHLGRCWKSHLHNSWMNGIYDCDDAGILQQIRNTFGPSWLVRFRGGVA